MFSLMTQALGSADLPVIEGVAIAGALIVVTGQPGGRRRARVAGPARADDLGEDFTAEASAVRARACTATCR